MSDASVTKWELPDLFAQKTTARQPEINTAVSSATPSSKVEQQAGFEQGRKEGLESAKAETQAKLDVLDKIMESLATPLAQVDNQIARELIQLSVRLAETIVHREVEIQPDLVEKQVAEALATLTSKSSDIVIRLHPEDARILEKSRVSKDSPTQTEEGQAMETEGRGYRITSDPNLHRGGCILQTPTTLVDATIEKQLQGLLNEMLNSAAEC